MFRLTLSMLFLLSLTLVVAAGCSTTRTTNTARTGMEQLLISNAVDQNLDNAAFPDVQGRKVFVNDKYLDAVDKGYILGSIRQKVLSRGGQLVDAKDGSDVTIEVFSGGVGTDNTERYVGMPGLAVPGMPIELPEVRLYEKTSQFGTAKLGVVAYDTNNGQLMYDNGKSLARADDTRWSVLGIGPFEEGSVRSEVRRGSTPPTAFERLANQAGDEIRFR